MNSCLYDCTVMHHRLVPLRNRFVYRIFMFALDLDEVDVLDGTLRLFSRNRFNLFSFRDRDHLNLSASSARENITAWIRSQGVTDAVGKIVLVTNVRTLGHVFNPVSFFYCYRPGGEPLCAVAEVGNTFRELKPYLLDRSVLEDGIFRRRVEKLFYVSPFIDHDSVFDFRLGIPGRELSIRIDDHLKGERIFLSTLTGVRRELTDGALIRSFLRVPFVTLQVIGLIHWQALKLYLKRLPFRRKGDDVHLQQGAYVWNK